MKIIECPRDAWQGFHPFIPTERKAAYLNQLLKVGFDTIDFGSFVSAKAMPQVSDTAALLDNIQIQGSKTRLLAIVANERGASEACQFDPITDLGYPFSISETFQLRNANSSVAQSFERVKHISELCQSTGKQLVIYISMGFGNPYGDPWGPDVVLEWVDKLALLGVNVFSLADTVGLAKTEDITLLFSKIIPTYPLLEFGAHFHTIAANWRIKIEAAYNAGCRRFDGALLGYGGCPMAQDELVGNMPTERLIEFARAKEGKWNINADELKLARGMFLDLVRN